MIFNSVYKLLSFWTLLSLDSGSVLARRKGILSRCKDCFQGSNHSQTTWNEWLSQLQGRISHSLGGPTDNGRPGLSESISYDSSTWSRSLLLLEFQKYNRFSEVVVVPKSASERECLFVGESATLVCVSGYGVLLVTRSS